jgi:excisionase family DNA binding protein
MVTTSASDLMPLLLSIEECAAVIGLSTRTVYRLIEDDHFPESIPLRSIRKWRRSDIEAWVAAGCPKQGKEVRVLPIPGKPGRSGA